MGRRQVKYDLKFSQFGKVRLAGDKKQEAVSAVGEFVRQKILADMDAQRSSVTGTKWQKLSKSYAEKKGPGSIADLLLTGKYREALKYQEIPGGVRFTFDSDQQKKADGHNNFSGDSNLPLRQSLPDAEQDQDFRDPILNGVQRIIDKLVGY